MSVPADLHYTAEHEWIMMEGNVASVGITDWAQSELGDIVYLELPEVGSVIELGEPFGTIEAVKAVSDLYAPLTGKVVEVNAALDDDPMVVNRDAYGEGWMIKVKIDNMDQLNDLLDATGYANLITD